MAYKSHAGSQPPPTPDDFEIHSQAQLQEACYDKPSLCMLVLLDGGSDTVNKYKDTTKKAALALQVGAGGVGGCSPGRRVLPLAVPQLYKPLVPQHVGGGGSFPW